VVIAVSVSTPLGSGARYTLVVALAIAMGVQNAAAQRLAVAELTTTVLTRTLTGLASDSPLAGASGARVGRRLVAITAMLAGAIIGAALALHGAVTAAIALALALSVATASHRLSDSQAGWAVAPNQAGPGATT
jgi:uncharacterized membrane protein YoaK (UPF0700 family)